MKTGGRNPPVPRPPGEPPTDDLPTGTGGVVIRQSETSATGSGFGFPDESDMIIGRAMESLGEYVWATRVQHQSAVSDEFWLSAIEYSTWGSAFR